MLEEHNSAYSWLQMEGEGTTVKGERSLGQGLSMQGVGQAEWLWGSGRGRAGRGPTGLARGGAWCAARPDPAPLQTSHAITLQKTVEYITKLQQERSQMQEEARRLREEIEELNATIL